jgi:hypothetical protein
MNKYFMPKPTLHISIMAKINMNEIIMPQIERLK